MKKTEFEIDSWAYEYQKIRKRPTYITYEENIIKFDISGYDFFPSYEHDEDIVEKKLVESDELRLRFSNVNTKRYVPLFGIIQKYLYEIIKKYSYVYGDDFVSKYGKLKDAMGEKLDSFEKEKSINKIKWLNENKLTLKEILTKYEFNVENLKIELHSKQNIIIYSNIVQTGEHLILIK